LQRVSKVANLPWWPLQCRRKIRGATGMPRNFWCFKMRWKGAPRQTASPELRMTPCCH
jgi:hypothetical protein